MYCYLTLNNNDKTVDVKSAIDSSINIFENIKITILPITTISESFRSYSSNVMQENDRNPLPNSINTSYIYLSNNTLLSYCDIIYFKI